MKSNVRWRIQGASALKSVATDWDALAARVAGDHPLLRSEFLVPLVGHFGTSRTFLVTRHDAGNILSSAALVERSSVGRMTTFCPAQLQLCPILTEDVCTLVDGVFSKAGAASLAILRFDPKYQPEPDADALSCHSSDYATTFAVDCLRPDFDSYWRARSKWLKKNMKRYGNRIERSLGGARYAIVRDVNRIAEAVERYADLESRGWKGREGTGLYRGSRQTDFYTDCLLRFAASREASVHELHVGQSLIASRLCIQHNSILVILKTAYDETFSQYSPSNLLLLELIRYAFSAPEINTVEFYTKADHNRLAWGNEQRGIRDITIYRNGVVAAAAAIRRSLVRHIPG